MSLPDGPCLLSLSLDTDAATASLPEALFPGLTAPNGALAALALSFRAGPITGPDLADPAWQVAERLDRGQPVSVHAPQGQRWFDHATRTESLLDHDRTPPRGRVVIENPAGLPAWARAAPGLRVIDWWAGHHGMLAAHASAIAFPQGAILCLGPSGSGKSTLAIEAALAGDGFLGDDYVLVTPPGQGATPRVQGLFRSAKLLPHRLPAGLAAAPWIAPTAPEAIDETLVLAGEDKAIYLMPDAVCHPPAPILAIVVPHVAHAARAEPQPAHPATLVRRVAPSILRQLPGNEPGKLAALTRLVTGLPCYTLPLAEDGARNRDALATLAARHAP